MRKELVIFISIQQIHIISLYIIWQAICIKNSRKKKSHLPCIYICVLLSLLFEPKKKEEKKDGDK